MPTYPKVLKRSKSSIQAKPVTIDTLIEMVEDWETYNMDVSIDDTTISCGVFQLEGIGAETPQKQALYLLKALLENGRGTRREAKDGAIVSSQVIFSDAIGVNYDKAWKEAKAIAYKGPITVNPNSGNKIQIFIVTMAEIMDIYNS